jgi:hypothetical protein
MREIEIKLPFVSADDARRAEEHETRVVDPSSRPIC